MNVSLPDQVKAFVEAQSEDGKFSNASDYVRHLIRQDQERQQAIGELQAPLDEAEANGDAGPFDFDTFREKMRAKYGV